MPVNEYCHSVLSTHESPLGGGSAEHIPALNVRSEPYDTIDGLDSCTLYSYRKYSKRDVRLFMVINNEKS